VSGFYDTFLQTLRSLRAHRLRFILTSLGIFWGAVMLTYLSASAVGIEDEFSQQLERTGPKTIWAFPGVVTKDRVGERGARILELEPEDVDRLESLDLIESSTGEVQLWSTLVRSDQSARLLTVVGMDEDGLDIRNFATEHGRKFSAAEVERGARVALLGWESAERLFGQRPAVGKTIRLDGVPFRVVGVAKQKGDQLMNMGDRDDQLVVVPITAAFRWLQRDDTIGRFIVAPRTREESEQSIRAIRSVMAVHHEYAPDSEMALNFVDVQEIWMILDTLFLGLKVFLVGAGVVTLLVGAIGVMNIMLVVVGERTQEIGLRKALGASDRAVFALFLAEAVAISAVAGLSGGALGLGLIRLTQRAADAGSSQMSRPVIDWDLIAVALGVLMVVAVMAGILPAVRAARTSPAESLRGG